MARPCGACRLADPACARPRRFAERVLLPGDPGRALALAQSVLGNDRLMFNHHRGLCDAGTAADGQQLTIQTQAMGRPTAAIVLEELVALGVRRAVRVRSGAGIVRRDAGLR